MWREKKEEKKFSRKEVVIENINWISAFSKNWQKISSEDKIPPAAGRVQNLQGFQNSAKIVFDNPQRAVTPGQSLVIYDREEMMGEGCYSLIYLPSILKTVIIVLRMIIASQNQGTIFDIVKVVLELLH